MTNTNSKRQNGAMSDRSSADPLAYGNDKVVRVHYNAKMTNVQKLLEGKGVSHVDNCGTSIPDRAIRQY